MTSDLKTGAASAALPLQLCSQASRSAGDDPAGSAAEFSSFLLLDRRASWTASAAEDAVGALGPELAAAVTAVPGLRAFAIRNVHPRQVDNPPVAISGLVGADGHLVKWASLPLAADIEHPAPPAAPERPASPLFAVCTNGRRDRCCAIVGRGIAVGLHDEFGSSVVEISHLGGHRFAGTMLVLPWGYAYGFLDLAGAQSVARAAANGLVHPDGLRGRADLVPAAQAAEVLLRREIGPAAPDAVRIVGVDIPAEGSLPVGSRDLRVKAEVLGRPRSLLLRRLPGPSVRDTLCGGKPFGTGSWTIAPN